MSSKIKPEEMLKNISYKVPNARWIDNPVEFRKGTYNHGAVPDSIKYIEQPNPRKWQPYEDDWQLPNNWKEIVFEGMRERLDKFRSL